MDDVDVLMIALRIIHVVAGVFWAGSAFFMVMILEPRLRALGPQYQGPVMGAIAPVIPPILPKLEPIKPLFVDTFKPIKLDPPILPKFEPIKPLINTFKPIKFF